MPVTLTMGRHLTEKEKKNISHSLEFWMEKLTLSRLNLESLCVSTNTGHFCIFI